MESWPLVPVLLLFLGTAGACLVLGVWRQKGEDPIDAATSSAGTEMRRRLQLLLLLANLARAVCLAAEAALFEDGACPDAWTCVLVRCAPDLLFLTTYSMLILFWAQLSHTATGSPFPLLRPAFLVSNGLLYATALVIVCLAASGAIATTEFVQALFYLLGFFYICSTAFLLKYGLRMLSFSQLVLPPVLRRRLLLLCTVCSAVFLLHALYYLAVAGQAASGTATAWALHGGYPPEALLPGGSAYGFDALFYPLMELLPSVAILFALHHKRRAYADSIPYTKISSGGGPAHGAQMMMMNGGGGGGNGSGRGPPYFASTSKGGGGVQYQGGGGQQPGAGGGGGGGGGMGGGYYQGGHLHPMMFSSGGGGGGGQRNDPYSNVVVREGNGAGPMMMGLFGGGGGGGPDGAVAGAGGGPGVGANGVTSTPSTSSGSNASL